MSWRAWSSGFTVEAPCLVRSPALRLSQLVADKLLALDAGLLPRRARGRRALPAGLVCAALSRRDLTRDANMPLHRTGRKRLGAAVPATGFEPARAFARCRKTRVTAVSVACPPLAAPSYCRS